VDVGHDCHGPIGQPDPDRLREHGSPRSAGPRPPRQSFVRSTMTVAADAGSSAWATPVVLKFAKGSEVALRGARGRSSRSGTAAEPMGQRQGRAVSRYPLKGHHGQQDSRLRTHQGPWLTQSRHRFSASSPTRWPASATTASPFRSRSHARGASCRISPHLLLSGSSPLWGQPG
jgi:hypothetical protein